MRPRLRTGLVLVLALLGSVGCSHLVLLHDPLSASEHNDLGVAYERNGTPILARREYRRSLRLEPHASVPRANLGNLAAASGDWSEAEKHYRRALGDSATHADAMNNLAFVLSQQRGKRTDAIVWAQRAVALGGVRDSVYRRTLAEVTARPQ